MENVKFVNLKGPSYLQCFILIFVIPSATCDALQPGVFEFNLSSSNPIGAAFKSLYNQTDVRILPIEGAEGTGTVKLSWELRYTQCEGLYGSALNGKFHGYEEELFTYHELLFDVENYINVGSDESKDFPLTGDNEASIEVNFPAVSMKDGTCYVGNKTTSPFRDCLQGTYINTDGETAAAETVEDNTNKDGETAAPKDGETAAAETVEDNTNKDGGDNTNKDGGDDTDKEEPTRKRRQAQDNEAAPKKDDTAEDQQKGENQKQEEVLGEVFVTTVEDGSHLLLIKLEVIAGTVKSFPVKVHMKGKHGYLSASQYKLLPFYGIMCGMYMLMGFTWLFLMCYQYKDLLGIQIWIGVVILLGLIEKAVFFGEFEHMNNYGEQSSLGILFPEIVSCIKRTLARLLVVIVSIGYGITRPRLGNDLNYIMAAGLAYLLLSSAEAIMRNNNSADHRMAAVLPLSILDAIIVWWIFRNLVDTTRVLRLRQNETKLWLYRHFTNTLLLCVLLSFIFFVWSMKTHQLNTCIMKWEELWLDDAFWHILFCVILVVIMILFRPSINNQRYAYSPLIDEDQDEEESKEPMLPESYEGMKMRNLKKDSPQNAVMDIAEDLKWVEDNIPAAIADTALSMMDDSDDELMANTERSKMD